MKWCPPPNNSAVSLEDHRHAECIHRHRSGQDHLSRGCTGRTQQVTVGKRFSRAQLLAIQRICLRAGRPGRFAQARISWVLHFREQGHELWLIPAQFVRPYRKSNKNDFIAGEAIAEAIVQQYMRFVRSSPRSSWMCRPYTEFTRQWSVSPCGREVANSSRTWIAAEALGAAGEMSCALPNSTARLMGFAEPMIRREESRRMW